MRVDDFNALDQESAERELLQCCASARWAKMMAELRPFENAPAMADSADGIWRSLDATDWQEAFAAHPRIGSHATGWAGHEQSRAREATDDDRARLAEGNRQYEMRFGYIFIVCAEGKTAGEMLDLLEKRLQNEPAEELAMAAEEQRKITRVRLAKLVDPAPVTMTITNTITTHVLDTARSGPAAGVTVILELRHAGEWSPIGRGTTDKNGRVTTLTDDKALAPGTYRLTFDTGSYHREQGISAPFFPEAKITFNVRDTDEHYHVPLLLSPFGYTTYRGT